MSAQPSHLKGATLRAANSSSVMNPRLMRNDVPCVLHSVAMDNGRQRVVFKKAAVGQTLTDGPRWHANHEPGTNNLTRHTSQGTGRLRAIHHRGVSLVFDSARSEKDRKTF